MGNYVSVPMVVAIAIPMIAGSAVSATTTDNILVWYKTLKKPSWNLPTPIFGPTWGFLYAFLGLASFVVWTQGGFAQQTGPLVLYAINLGLNLAWPAIFFNQKDFGLAQIDNLATLATAIVLAKWFYRVKPVAGYLLWPYVAFLTFANALNYFHLTNNSERAIEEDLHEPTTKKNPGEAGYEAPAGNPQGYADDGSKVNKGGLSTDSLLRKGQDYGGSTTGDQFQRPGGSTTGGSFKPTGALGGRPAPAQTRSGRALLPRPAIKQSKFLGRGLAVRTAAPAPRALSAARFA